MDAVAPKTLATAMMTIDLTLVDSGKEPALKRIVALQINDAYMA
jgi:hypothetical protein